MKRKNTVFGFKLVTTKNLLAKQADTVS